MVTYLLYSRFLHYIPRLFIECIHFLKHQAYPSALIVSLNSAREINGSEAKQATKHFLGALKQKLPNKPQLLARGMTSVFWYGGSQVGVIFVGIGTIANRDAFSAIRNRC